MKRRLPVIFAGTNCLSGVTSWADQLRDALADHPRYEPMALHVGPERPADCHLVARTLEEALSLVRRMAPAIVVPNYVWPLFLAGFEPGIRCLGMCHADSDDQYYRPLSWYEPATSRFIAVSKECAERLASYVPCRKSDVTMLPYGVNIPPLLARDYRTKPLRMIYAGRVTQPQKRVWDFLPLVEHLLRRKVPFVFDIIGDGDEFAPLQQVLRARAPAADVHFHGRVPHSEMGAKWLEHDIFLQVSDFEGTSVSMLEAMAHGVTPVVTAASSGIEGVITPRENGFIVPIGNMAMMADVIAELAGNEPLLADVGREAYRTAQAYAMDSYVRKFVRILDEMVEADETVDYKKRYGVYSPTHPLLVQRQLLERPNPADIEEHATGLNRFLPRGLKRLRRRKSRGRNNRRAA